MSKLPWTLSSYLGIIKNLGLIIDNFGKMALIDTFLGWPLHKGESDERLTIVGRSRWFEQQIFFYFEKTNFGMDLKLLAVFYSQKTY